MIFRNLPRSIYLLCFAKTLMAAGNFVYPFLALYLTSKLGMKQDVAGSFFLAANIGSIFGSISGGTLSDLVGRKTILVSALSLSGFCYLLAPLVHSPVVTIVLVFLSLSLLAATEPAFNALVGDLTPRGQSKEAFSLIYIGHNVGFTIGPLIGALLFTSHTSLIFFGDGAATCAAALVILAAAGTAPSSAATMEREERAPASIGFFAAIRRNAGVLIFCLLFCAHPIIYSQTTFSFPLFLEQCFSHKGALYYGMLMAVNGIAVVALTPVLTHATKGIPSLHCVASGIALYALGFGVYFFTHNIIVIGASVLVWSAGEILALTNAKAFIAENSDPSNRGRFNTILDISMEAGFGIGPGVAGRIIMFYGMRAVWPIVATAAMVASSGLLLLGHVRGRTSEHSSTP
jgi:MFS family permease